MPHRFLRSLLLALFVACAACAPVAALAQDPPPPAAASPAPAPSPAPTPAPAPATGQKPEPSALIDQAKSQLDQVLAALRRDSLDDAGLQALRSQLDPAAVAVKTAIDRLTPMLDNSKARLDQLGPKPDDKAAPESPIVTADRAEQQQHYNDTDEALKRARLLALQIEQTGTTIVSRRRAIFVSSLFQRSYSIVSPELWRGVADEVGGDLRALRFVAGDFISSTGDRLQGWRLPVFLALIALIGLLNVPLYHLVQRILSREPTIDEPGRLAKALAACWVAIVVSIAPIATIAILFALADVFDLSSARLLPLKKALVDAVGRVALTAGLARGLLAPSRPNWRLIAISTPAAERLSRLAITLAVVVSIAKIVDSMNEIIGASLRVTAATQVVGAFAFAAIVASAIYGLGEDQVDEDEECLGPRVVERPRWMAALRLATWTALCAITGAALLGYIPFAAFLVDQFVWVAAVTAALCILVPLLTQAIEEWFQPSTRLGRTLVAGVGVGRDSIAQFGILLSGLLQLLLLGLGALVIVVPWGVQSDDLMGAVRNAFFGFKVGEVTISPWSIIAALLLFGLGTAATRGVQGWLDKRLMPATSLDVGLRTSIRTSIGYVGFILAAALALAHVGLGLDRIAIVAGALSVGIGFGLQSIVNNFVSGIIVLWERSVRVGDLVIIGDDQGFVRKINVRATEIETFDRATMIVPNSNLITGVVKNWVRNDRVARIKIALTLNTGVDPERVRSIMTGAAKAHDSVSKIPAPATLFVSMEPGGLKFELVCFVDEVETSGRVKSDLHYEIFRRFGEEGISIGSPSSVQVSLQGPAADAISAVVRGAAS